MKIKKMCSRYFVALVSTAASCGAWAETVSVQCGSSTGWSYYFAGGLVDESQAGFTEDGVTGGKITLVIDDAGNGEVLFVDASGQLGSVTEQGGEVLVMNALGGINWFLMYPDGTLENYALNLASMKAAAWRNTVGNQTVAKNSLFVTDCELK